MTKEAVKPSEFTVRHKAVLNFNENSPLSNSDRTRQNIRFQGMTRGFFEKSFPPASSKLRLRPLKHSDHNEPKLNQLVSSSSLEECFPNHRKAMALAIGKFAIADRHLNFNFLTFCLSFCPWINLACNSFSSSHAAKGKQASLFDCRIEVMGKAKASVKPEFEV
eukprot:764054-Hanusia_phi.AAC.9